MTTGKQTSLTCWTKSTSLIRLANLHLGGAASKRHGRAGWIHSQLNYIMAREGDIRRFWKVGFRSPPIHDSDHPAVVAHMWKGKDGSLKTYQCNRQRFPITLPPGEQKEKTRLFEELKALCDHPDPKQHPSNRGSGPENDIFTSSPKIIFECSNLLF